MKSRSISLAKEYPYITDDKFLDELNKYINNFKYAFEKSFSALKAQDDIDLAKWMDDFYKKPMEEGVGSAWRSRNIQKGIMLALTIMEIQKIFFIKPTQFGGSTIATAAQCYMNTIKHLNTCYYLPTDTEAEEHSKSKWSTMIRDVPALNDALIAPDVEKQHPKNSIGFKLFRTSSAYCRGSQAPARFQRITLHFAILDEIDRMKRNVGKIKKGEKGEGSPIKLTEGRFGEQGYGKMFVLGTPTKFGDSPIYENCIACENQYNWHAPCPHKNCKKEQIMVWGDKKLPYGFKWDESLSTIQEQVDSCYYICKHCNQKFKHKEFRINADNGRWVNNRNGDWIDTKDMKFRDKNNIELRRPPKEIAFMASTDCSGLLSNTSWEDGLESFIKAVKRANNGDNTELVSWFNTYAGQPFREKAQKESDPNELIKRREDYYGTIPFAVQKLTMGVDFQEKFCKYQIDGHGYNGEQWALFCERIEGRTDDEKSELWGVLESIANETYYREQDNKPLNIEVVIADAGYNRANVLKWCGRNRDQRIAVKGDGKRLNRGIFEVDWKHDYVEEYNCYYVTINPYIASRRLYHKLSINKQENSESNPNYYHYPISDKFNVDYFNELTADKETLVKDGRDWVKRYVTDGNTQNEAHDIAKYQFIALEVLELTGRSVYAAKNADMAPYAEQKSIEQSIRDKEIEEKVDTDLKYLEALYGVESEDIKNKIKSIENEMNNLGGDSGFDSIYK